MKIDKDEKKCLDMIKFTYVISKDIINKPEYYNEKEG